MEPSPQTILILHSLIHIPKSIANSEDTAMTFLIPKTLSFIQEFFQSHLPAKEKKYVEELVFCSRVPLRSLLHHSPVPELLNLIPSPGQTAQNICSSSLPLPSKLQSITMSGIINTTFFVACMVMKFIWIPLLFSKLSVRGSIGYHQSYQKKQENTIALFKQLTSLVPLFCKICENINLLKMR